MAGLFLGGAAEGIPVVIDGIISEAAALAAYVICPNCVNYMIASHLSKEPAAQMILSKLGLDAMLDCEMHLGEGTGALTLFPILDLACVHVAQLIERQFLNSVLRIDDRNDGVVGDRVADGLMAGLGEIISILFLEITRGHRNIGRSVHQRLDAVAGTAAGDHQLDVGVGGHEGFGGLLHDGQHGGGAVDDDILGVGGHAQTQGGTGKDQSFGEIHDSAPLKGKKSLLRLDPEAPPFSSGFVTEM